MGRKAVVQKMPEAVFPKEPPPEVADELDEVEAEAGEPDDALVGDNIGEASVEINVEGLIAELEAESRFVSKPDMISARRKLEDFLERRRVAREIEDFDDFKVLD
jgi:hypothetical protein